MPALLAGLSFIGRLIWNAGAFVVRTAGRAMTYVPKTPRGKFLYGGATASSVYYFSDDQYAALEHVFIHPGSTHDFAQVVREYMHSDISFAKSASNYLTGDYGRTFVIHVGLLGVSLIPIGLMAASGIRSAKAVTSSPGLLAQWGIKIKNVKFSDFIGLFNMSASAATRMSSLAGRVPVSKRQKFLNDFYAYFKKVNMKGKPSNAKGTDSVHARMTGLNSNNPTGNIQKGLNVMIRKDVLALETIMAMFFAMWLAINDDFTNADQMELAEEDMRKLDMFVNDKYNFFFTNTILGGDIHKIKVAMRVDYSTAKHVFISYGRLGVKLIDTWLALNEVARLRFHRLLLMQMKGIYAVMQGEVTSTNISIALFDNILDKIASGNLADLVSILALQRVVDTTTKKAMYSGSDDYVTFRYLFYFIGDNDEIKELYSDGAAASASDVNKVSNPGKVKQTGSKKNPKQGATPANNTNTKPVIKPDSKEKGANNDSVAAGKGSYEQHITADMLTGVNDLVESVSNV